MALSSRPRFRWNDTEAPRFEKSLELGCAHDDKTFDFSRVVRLTTSYEITVAVTFGFAFSVTVGTHLIENEQAPLDKSCRYPRSRSTPTRRYVSPEKMERPS
jgi:hypothetical protein